jgi:hypothetical protein
MKRTVTTVFATLFLLGPITIQPCFPWGNDGHEYVALLAAKILESESPQTLQKVNALLATDTNNDLTPNDIASEATWADAFRGSSTQARELSAQWHFVDIDFNQPNLDAACFGHPKLSPGELATQGPSPDCIVDKIKQFAAELANPDTSDGERLGALKFLLHFVGDIHQPLHAANRNDPDTGRSDRGANCIGILHGNATKPTRLHSYWDTALVVHALSKNADTAMQRLTPLLTPSNKQKWLSSTDARDWALESFDLAKGHAYAGVIDTPPVQTDFIFKDPFHGTVDTQCGPSKVYHIGATYDAQASDVVKAQIAKAAVRLAWLLQHNLK